MWCALVVPASAAEFLPLETLTYSVDVVGPLAEITVRERFRNVSDQPVDALYVFPLESGSVVDGMWLRIETREIRGEIQPRAEARRVYEAARSAGKVSALTESATLDTFTQDVSNLPPGAAVEVELRIVRPVSREEGIWTLPIALVAAPRFVPLGVAPIPTAPARDTGVRAELEVVVHAATGVRWLEAAPYPDRPDLLGSRGRIELADLPLERDVTVRWKTERSIPQASVLATPTHAMLLVEGGEVGAARAWWDLSADWVGCPVTELTAAPSRVDDRALFQSIGLRTGGCRGPVVLTGQSAHGPLRWELMPREVPRPRALASAWARARVRMASDPAEVLALGMRWGIVTPETSFVAVDPGAAGVKVARMAPPDEPDLMVDAKPRVPGYFAPVEIGLDDHEEGEERRFAEYQLREKQKQEDYGPSPRKPAAPMVLERRRPAAKSPLLVGGAVAVVGGATACALGGRTAHPAAWCVGGLAVGGLGATSLVFGTVLDGT